MPQSAKWGNLHAVAMDDGSAHQGVLPMGDGLEIASDFVQLARPFETLSDWRAMFLLPYE